MKKIININLSGRVIPIEDSAYEKLQVYIESLRRYFANEESRDEIINDIESRIAELLHEKIRKGAETTTDADIDEIIASMGTAEDFEAAEKENIAASGSASSSSSAQGGQQQYSYSEKKSKGRLYRDSNDRFIGGVCSGIANYLNIDPSVIRIIFAIISFGGFGLGFLAYIILWIVLPPKDLQSSYGKRLYRNPDNRILGGVAGGLAAYFNRSASTIRIIFAAPILLSILINIIRTATLSFGVGFIWNIGFGSLTGTFILAYIILWIVLPDANSDYQKMEMRGETVDVNRIRQNVKEGVSNMKDRMKAWGDEVKTSAENIGNRTKEMSGKFREEVRQSGGGIGHAIGVIFKIFVLFIAGSIAFALFVAVIAILFGGVAWWPVNNFLWTSKWQQAFAWGTLIFFLLVPLVGFVTWIIRRLIRARSRNNYLRWTFGGLWLLGWVCAVLFASSVSNDFRVWKNDGGTELTLAQPGGSKMIVAVTEAQLAPTGNMWWMDNESPGWDLTNDTLRLSTVKIDDVQPSYDANYHVIIKKYSCGKTAEEAIDRATGIQYKASSRDSVLDLGSGYAISKDKKFRFQQVRVEILVPVGKKIRFDESVKEKLSQVNFKIKRKKKKPFGVEIEEEKDWHSNFGHETGMDYIMGEDRQLHELDGKPVSTTITEEWKDSSSANAIQQQLEEARKKQKQDSINNINRIKELEEKQKEKENKSTTFPAKEEKDNTVAGGPSPFFTGTIFLSK
jgi:phage shock protein PspC (stress-responsive transcriptional regulator)